MNVGSQAHVVRQVPAHVVGIVIDDYVIRIPEPVVAVIVVIRRNGKKESAECKPFAVAAADPPDVMRANRSGEMPVLPGMVEMIVRVAASAIVSDPMVVLSMNVRSLRMSLGIVEFTMLVLRRRRMRSRSPHRCGTVRRNMTPAHAVFAASVAWGRPMSRRSMSRLSALVLSVNRQSKQQCSNRQSR